jgi:hypothetical protein
MALLITTKIKIFIPKRHVISLGKKIKEIFIVSTYKLIFVTFLEYGCEILLQGLEILSQEKLFREFSPILLLTGYEVTHVVILNLWFGFSDIKHPSITLFDGIH